MGAFFLRRLIQAILVVVGVSVVVFMLLHLSGDPAALLLPPDASAEDIARFRHQMGFDDPLYVQYVRFINDALHGTFGQSLRYNQPALGLVLERLPATLRLAGAALLLALAVAFPVGILAALRRGSAWDNLTMLCALVGQSMPGFWLGIMLILLVAVRLRLLPASGYGGVDHLALPAVALSLFSMARNARLIRSGMLEVLGQDYVRTARAKGLAELLVVRRHVLRNVLVPVVTIIGLDLGTLLGGAVITETIFAWPGVGRLAVQAIQFRDYPLVQAAVFLVALGYVLANLLVDVLYAYLNPRIRLAD